MKCTWFIKCLKLDNIYNFILMSICLLDTYSPTIIIFFRLSMYSDSTLISQPSLHHLWSLCDTALLYSIGECIGCLSANAFLGNRLSSSFIKNLVHCYMPSTFFQPRGDYKVPIIIRQPEWRWEPHANMVDENNLKDLKLWGHSAVLDRPETPTPLHFHHFRQIKPLVYWNHCLIGCSVTCSRTQSSLLKTQSLIWSRHAFVLFGCIWIIKIYNKLLQNPLNDNFRFILLINGQDFF